MNELTVSRITQIVEFSVVTPELSKFIKPVDRAFLNVIPGSGPDLTTYMIELLGTGKPEQRTSTFWFPTNENPDENEDRTPIQIRILEELKKLKEKETLNNTDNAESRRKFLERFDWTDTLLTELEKHAVENILVVNHVIFARHRMDI